MSDDRGIIFDFFVVGWVLGVCGVVSLGLLIAGLWIVGVLGLLACTLACLFLFRVVLADYSPCSLCEGRRIVLFAGDAKRDDGYCELRECRECGTGQRLGRSDVPIASDYDALLLRRVK